MLALTISARASAEPESSCPCCDGYGTHDDHIVQVDADGEFVGKRNRRQRLGELFRCVKKSGRKNIILYVHGGRKSLPSAVATAKRLGPIIWCEETDAYPIFFCWDTEQFNSYFRHLAYERNGVSYRGSYAAGTSALGAPLVFAADVGQGVTRLPINTALSFGKLLQNSDLILGSTRHLFPVKKKYEEKLTCFVNGDVHDAIHTGFTYPTSQQQQCANLHLALGRDAKSYRLKFLVQQALTLPFQFTTEPIIDTIGTPAWGNMLRRTRSMFHPSKNYVSQPPPPEPYDRGAGTDFFEELKKHLHEDNLKLEIYAHSMGAIVINEAYARFPDLPADPIVFMAAACSIREFRDTTGRYIEKNPNVSFYNLSLHPRAELDDVEAFGVPVRGSLLVWIDEFFENPKSFGDRTLGTFENIIIAQDLLPKSKSIHLKAFPIEDGEKTKERLYLGPQRHGDFDDYHFWDEEFRTTDHPNCYYPRISRPPEHHSVDIECRDVANR